MNEGVTFQDSTILPQALHFGLLRIAENFVTAEKTKLLKVLTSELTYLYSIS